MISFSIRFLFFLGLMGICATGLVTIISYTIIHFAISDYEFSRILIPALGSIAGGIIGGLVAIIIAVFNHRKISDNERKKQLRMVVSILVLLREEIRDNLCTLSTLLEDEHGDKACKKHLTDDVWKSVVMHLLVSESLVIRLNVFYKRVVILKAEDTFELESIRRLQMDATALLENIKKEQDMIKKELGDCSEL